MTHQDQRCVDEAVDVAKVFTNFQRKHLSNTYCVVWTDLADVKCKKIRKTSLVWF